MTGPDDRDSVTQSRRAEPGHGLPSRNPSQMSNRAFANGWISNQLNVNDRLLPVGGPVLVAGGDAQERTTAQQTPSASANEKQSQGLEVRASIAYQANFSVVPVHIAAGTLDDTLRFMNHVTTLRHVCPDRPGVCETAARNTYISPMPDAC